MNRILARCGYADPDRDAGFSLSRPASILFTDEATLCDWIAHAAPGASTLYFRGHLGYDRMPSAKTFHEPERKRLIAVARRAMQAAEDGLVHLVQRRHGPRDYSYLAVKADLRRPGHGAGGDRAAGR